MKLNPWARCEGYAKCEQALELNGHQVLFECGHGKYWYLSDRVLPQVEHVYLSTTIPIPPCLTIWLAELLANEEIAWARDGYIVTGVEGNYSEFVQDHLQGCLVGRTVFLFPSNFCSANSFFIFLLGNSICMLDFQPPSTEGEEEKEIPSLHHASDSSSSFIETYPHFPAWQYDVMNLMERIAPYLWLGQSMCQMFLGPIQCVLECSVLCPYFLNGF